MFAWKLVILKKLFKNQNLKRNADPNCIWVFISRYIFFVISENIKIDLVPRIYAIMGNSYTDSMKFKIENAIF